MTADPDIAFLALRAELEDFYGRYAAIIDEKRPNDWVSSFTPTGIYRVGSHNNMQAMGMWWYTDQGSIALKERAAYTHGYFWHAPSSALHTIMNIMGQKAEEGIIHARASFAVYVADRTERGSLHVAGRYDDRLIRDEAGLRFVEHRVIVLGETIPDNMGMLL